MGVLNAEVAYGVAAAGCVLYLYEFYHDVIRRGQYEFEIAKMHKIYGPIVRINPYELHIDNPDYIDTLYPGTGGGKVDKWAWVMKIFGNQDSTFGTSPHDLHRRRRAAVSPFFSKRAVAEFEPVIRYYVDKLLVALQRQRGSPLNMVDCWSCLTGDIIADYCFGSPQGFLDSPDFSPKWHKVIADYGEAGRLNKHFGWVLPLMQSLPSRVAEALNPPMTEVAKLFRLINRQLSTVVNELSGQNNQDMKASSHRTIVHEVLSSDLPTSEKDLSRLTQEAVVFMVAGTTTTADTLALITFYLLQHDNVLKKVRDELGSLQSSKPKQADAKTYPKLQELEQLPYLTAVIQEGLRMCCGVVQRLARIHPDKDLRYEEWIIPRGTPVSMSSWLIHTNPSKFPEPHKFKPERWLDERKSAPAESTFAPEGGNGRLGKYLFSFGKGTRQCVGLNLAYAEMYLGLSALFTPGNIRFELFETDVSDVELVRDSFIPQVKDDSKGVRVIVQ